MARRIVAFSFLILLAGAALLVAYGFFAPVKGVAPGCNIFAGTEVAAIGPSFKGCARGYYQPGGEIAQTPDSSSYSLSLDLGSLRCDFRPDQFIVVRSHATTDEQNRLLLVVEACG
ncbi:MAG: hypothetical protein E6J29_07045 [Chloroflexi bacterium]|nr:MAG: hypothetical protein E6J29_07045 [Chloroflexota bacterium]